MNFLKKALLKINSLPRQNQREIELLKDQILNGKKDDIEKLQKVNGKMKVMVESGSFSFRVVK